MTEIKDIMTRGVVTLSEETPLLQASKLLVSKRIGGAPVVDQETRVVGILSESDVIRALQRPLAALRESQRRGKSYSGVGDSPLARDVLDFLSLDWLWYRWNMRSVERIFNALQESESLSELTVRDAMTSPAVNANPGDTVEKALKLMDEHGINRLPVVDSGERLVGIVARADLLEAVSRELERKRGVQ